MKCAICGKGCGEAFLRLGGYCGEEHREELLQMHRRRLGELRREDLRAVPDSLILATDSRAGSIRQALLARRTSASEIPDLWATLRSGDALEITWVGRPR